MKINKYKHDEGCSFLANLVRRISAVSGDYRADSTFLFQRISVLIQRLLLRSFCDETRPNDDI